MTQNARLISHHCLTDSLEDAVAAAKERIEASGDQPGASVLCQLEWLRELAAFPLGRFLLQHRGVDGYWTDYALTHPAQGRLTGQDLQGRPLSELELFLLDRAPVILATQQRFKIFLEIIQQALQDGVVLASVPCGLMGELLYLDYAAVENVKLIGIDLDAKSLALAKDNALQHGLGHRLQLFEQDAWEMNFTNHFDLISSNGLTIYEPNDERVLNVFQRFYRALKPGGKLITSFLTPPPTLDPSSEWKMRCIDSADLNKQKVLFSDIINVKWQHFRDSDRMRSLLQAAGYDAVEVVYDEAHIFPTAVAWKH